MPRYDLSIKILPDSQRLEVTGTIQLPAEKIERNFIELSLSEQMQNLQVSVVNPQTNAGETKLSKKERPSSQPGWGTTTWQIQPAHPFPANRPVSLRFSYDGGGDHSSFLFYLGQEICFGAGIGTAWYPEVEEFPIESDGELRGLRGTGNLNFVVPPDFKVYSPGNKGIGKNQNGQGNYHFEINEPVYFSFSAGKYFVERKSGIVPTSIYLLHSRQNTDEYLNGASKVLKALTQEFGKFPHPDFAIIEVPAEQGYKAGFAGASVDGFIFANTDFLNKKFNTAYFGHEISHQWWGNLIRSRTVEGRWMLNEGMAQFGSLRTVETLEGTAVAEQYRKTGYPGYVPNQNAQGYFNLARKGSDHRLSDLPKDDELSRALSDSKGFIVFDMLSRLIGRKKFTFILQDFIRNHAYQRVKWKEFLKAVDVRAGGNLTGFFEQWLERTGAPDFQLNWKQEGRMIRGKITQPTPYYRAVLEVEIKSLGHRLLKTVEVVNGQQEFNWFVPFKVNTITLDPNYKVLRWTPEFKIEIKNSASHK